MTRPVRDIQLGILVIIISISAGDLLSLFFSLLIAVAIHLSTTTDVEKVMIKSSVVMLSPLNTQ